MNAGQNSKYWSRWGAVCRKNNWQMATGRLASDAVKDASQHHTQVWYIAGALAEQSCHAIAADHLRHACHVHALGRDVSHTDFTNAQFDRLLLLWGNGREYPGLLVEPDHIAAQVAWDNPDKARKVALIRSIKEAAADEYICKITQNIWGTIYWEDLDIAALLGLNRKIKRNAPSRPGQPF